MNNLEKSQHEQGKCIQTFEPLLRIAIATAFERTGTDPYNIDSMVNDIFTEFPNITEEQITKSMRNGGLGMYGKTYKLTTQEVCIWIRTYLKDSGPIQAFHPIVIDN